MSDQDDELAALNRAISDVDQQSLPAPLPGEAQKKPGIDAAQAWAEIPESVGLIVTQFFPELKPVYGREACLEWGRHMTRVAEKYGWSSDGLPPEITVILASAGFVLPTFAAIKARQAAKPDQVPNGAPNPGA